MVAPLPVTEPQPTRCSYQIDYARHPHAPTRELEHRRTSTNPLTQVEMAAPAASGEPSRCFDQVKCFPYRNRSTAREPELLRLLVDPSKQGKLLHPSYSCSFNDTLTVT